MIGTRADAARGGFRDDEGLEIPSDDALAGLLPSLFRFAHLVTADAWEAEDIVIEAVAKTLPRWRRGVIREPDRYLRRVIVNDLNTRRRRRKLEARTMNRERASTNPASGARDSAHHVDTAVFVRSMLGQLPPRQRAVLALRFLEDRTVADVAELLDITEGTVKSQTSKALENARSLLKDGP